MRAAAAKLMTLLVLSTSVAADAKTLPLADRLVALTSPEGGVLLDRADARQDFLPLAMYFVTQRNTAFCGPATIAMLLNALDVPRPPSEATAGLGLYDQENVFTVAMEAVKPREAVAETGMSLAVFAAALEAHGLAVALHRAGEMRVDAFRRIASEALRTEGQFVAVNYLRAAIDQETGGHISPLAAYDSETDRFLVLDVARYKYPPVWVAADDLFDAMNTEAGRTTRGFVVVSRR
jgi:hypothetical protein